MVKGIKPYQCCGCSACASVCNHGAISMVPDALGFVYPRIAEDRCVDCGLCDKVCSFNENYVSLLEFSEPLAFAARQKDVGEVMRSRSGGVFAAICDYVFSKGGVVYGAGYEDHFKVVHKRVVTKEECEELRGSKYVQSDTKSIFRSVLSDLKNNKLVLFSGTACQTSALNSFIGDRYKSNLILVDIVCHGVPSPKLWQDYITYLEDKYEDEIVSLNFRDKEEYGWNTHFETFKFLKGENKRTFNYTFYNSLYFRRSCNNCYFTNTKRPSDITLADFWGVEKNAPELNVDNKGCNLVLVNSLKGHSIFQLIEDKLKVVQVNLMNSLQPNLQRPTEIHPKREQFEKDYIKKGFKYVYYKYGEDGLRYAISVFFRKLKSKVKIIFGIR